MSNIKMRNDNGPNCCKLCEDEKKVETLRRQDVFQTDQITDYETSIDYKY